MVRKIIEGWISMMWRKKFWEKKKKIKNNTNHTIYIEYMSFFWLNSLIASCQTR